MVTLQQDEIERRFVYHAPTDETRLVHESIRSLTRAFAEDMNDVLGEPSREASLFFTALEEASFWAHAHIARNRE